jgi:hypothetical protein
MSSRQCMIGLAQPRETAEQAGDWGPGVGRQLQAGSWDPEDWGGARSGFQMTIRATAWGCLKTPFCVGNHVDC